MLGLALGPNTHAHFAQQLRSHHRGDIFRMCIFAHVYRPGRLPELRAGEQM